MLRKVPSREKSTLIRFESSSIVSGVFSFLKLIDPPDIILFFSEIMDRLSIDVLSFE